MPARDGVPTGAPIWNDLTASDLDEAVEFYGQLFGWTYESYGAEYGDYGAFSKDGAVVAGIGQVQAPGQPVVWSVYLQTPDAAASVAAVQAAGGQVLADTMEVGAMGAMAVVADPIGAVFGLWEPREHHGFAVADEAAAPVWHELFTVGDGGFATAISFYEDVLGWTTKVQGDSDDFRYSVLDDGTREYAGVMDASGFLPEGAPAHWSVYFGSPDTDATVARVVELGGSLVMPAEDSPYGRMAVVADPQGAQFKIISVG